MDKKINLILLIILLVLVPVLGYFGHYLAVGSDQYEVIRFARDLARGSIFWRHPVFDLVKDRAEAGKTYSIHYGGYLLRDGKIFCKYAIGYPLILALSIKLFGFPSVFFANFFIYSFLLLLIYLLGKLFFLDRPFPPAPALGAGLLFFLLINQVWKLSATPHGDVASLAFLAGSVFFLVKVFPAKTSFRYGWLILAGFFLGFSAAIRLPNIILVLPGGLYLLARCWKRVSVAKFLSLIIIFALGILIGLAPVLYQNYRTSGNILKPPQIYEVHIKSPILQEWEDEGEIKYSSTFEKLRRILTVRSHGWGIGNIHAAIVPNLFHILVTYGPLFLFFFFRGLIKSWRKYETRFLFLPIIVLFLVFYSGRVRPLGRYLILLHPFMIILVMEGIAAFISTPDRKGGRQPSTPVYIIGILLAVALIWGDFVFRCLNLRFHRSPVWGVHLQYVVILGLALVVVVLWLRRTKGNRIKLSPLLVFNLAALAAVIINSLPKRIDDKKDLFQFPQARRLRADLNQILKPTSILFATKWLSQSLDLFTESHSLRPSDLEQLVPDYGEAYDMLMKHGYHLYLIDNRGKRNAAAYIPRIKDYYAVNPIKELPAAPYRLEGKFGKPVCTIYDIKRWQEKEVALELETPVRVNYLLSLYGYKIWDSLPRRTWVKAAIDGKPIPEKIENGINYIPLPPDSVSLPRTTFHVTSDEGLPEEMLLGWQWAPLDYVIDLGALAPIPDRVFLSESFFYLRIYHTTFRLLDTAGKVKIPTPPSPRKLLSAEIVLQKVSEKIAEKSWQVLFNDNPLDFLPIKSTAEWQTFRADLPQELIKGNLSNFELKPFGKDSGLIAVTSLRIENWFDTLELPTPESVPYLLKTGVRAPGGYDSEPRLKLNGNPLEARFYRRTAWAILAPDLLKKPLNRLEISSPGGMALFHVKLLRPLEYPLKIDIGSTPAREFMGKGFYPPEKYLKETPVCWTGGEAEIFLPFIEEEAEGIRLKIGYVGNRPPAALPARAELILDGEKLGFFNIEEGVREVEFDIPPGLVKRGVSLLLLKTPTWKPSECMDSGDERELGLMLDYVELNRE